MSNPQEHDDSRYLASEKCLLQPNCGEFIFHALG